MKYAKALFRALCSVKLAVVVILALAASLATGTILESLYDTPTAQYWVYRSIWFHGILGLLGLQIFFVALSRIPWKPRHIPFLTAHLGILTLLFGSWMTEHYGLDGSLRITEGETASMVEMDQNSLFLIEKDQVRSVPVPWVPINDTFHPFSVMKDDVPYDLTVDQFITHADPQFDFLPNPPGSVDKSGLPSGAVKLKITGGPMQISQELWLWERDPQWRATQMGPATFTLGEIPANAPKGRPVFAIQPGKDGSLTYRARSSSGELKEGHLDAQHAKGTIIEPGWKGGVKLTIVDVIPNARLNTTYVPSQMQRGQGAPTSAIHITGGKGLAADTSGAQVWLGLGDRTVLHIDGREVEVGYFPRRLVLPFSVRLEHFQVDHYDGTRDPSEYSSKVTALGKGGDKVEALISMNEPLHYEGITLYQASYEDAEPRPVTSIFTVNRDPGRYFKYLGSLLIVIGSISLFAMKLRQRKLAEAKARAIAAEAAASTKGKPAAPTKIPTEAEA